MMTAKEKLLQIVERAKGDDLERAELFFGGISEKLMDEQHGTSGHTRREVLEAYRRERREWAEAYALAKRA